VINAGWTAPWDINFRLRRLRVSAIFFSFCLSTIRPPRMSLGGFLIFSLVFAANNQMNAPAGGFVFYIL
jgi:hypothetical protein